ncbi:YitT family protein [Peribacillus kribbensis]|uniref:YitT family protein n=1 Tax=Peribacillus kribbensis TaxID=356658 RepID=UPI0003F648A2|nr:YitT family protein [Peribacillus kribbensis]
MLQKLYITIGASLLIGIGINGFIIPAHLINGGFWGISLIIHYLFGLKISLVFFCLNIPVYVFAGIYDKTYFINGVWGVTISSVIVSLLSPIESLVHLPALGSVLLGGVAIGTGVGLMLRQHISPGGIDLLALLLARIFSVNVGIALFILDLAIILAGIILLRDERLFYSIIIISLVGMLAWVITSVKSLKLYLIK